MSAISTLREKLLSLFPFLRITIPFNFCVNKSMGRCIALLEQRSSATDPMASLILVLFGNPHSSN